MNPLPIQAPASEAAADAPGGLLRRALDDCRPLLQELREVVFLTDAAGRWVYLGPSWPALLGWEVQASLGQRSWRHVLPAECAPRRALLRALIGQPGQRWQEEIRCVARDGSVRWIEVGVRLVRDAQGAVAGACGTLLDVTQRRRSEERLQLAASVFDGTHECILITDAQACILEVNDAFVAHTGYAREQVIGRTPALLASGRHDQAFYRLMWTSLLAEGYWSGELWNRRADGELVAEQVRIRAVRAHDGRPPHYVAIYSDITSLKRQQEDLARLAHYDALTGLPNRVLALDRLDQLIAQAERQGLRLAVCQLDLDHFKAINDAFGHRHSDAVLLEAARRLGLVLRSGDTVARLGGDEFLLLLGGVGSAVALEPLLQRVQAALAEPFAVDERQTRVTASMGVALYPEHGRTPEHLLRAADQAMYRAKRLGRNRACLADEEAEQPASEAALLQELHTALAAGELCLHYQPKVCARTGEPLGAEALVRWQHPRRGLLPPGAFLPLVLGTPLELQLDRWVICAAVAQLARWRQQGRTLGLSINVSPATLVLPDLADAVAGIVRGAAQDGPGGALEGIELEVLETAALEDLGAASRAIEACARHGISFALDDFGTGYSSLRYLRCLPVSTLKIDRSFVCNMLSDPGDLHIVRAVVGLAEAFGVGTVAEGVETAEHARRLAELGCHQLQGYGIARPMPARDLEEWLDRPREALRELLRLGA
jgi:diguanylate cyclase (GGDEF)-like protein/PAS domain S-box-containing protein